MGTVLVIAFLFIALLIVAGRLPSILQSLKDRRTDAKRRKEIAIEQASAAKAREESQQKESLENLKYNRIINCPYCFGTGRAIIRREWKKANEYGHMNYSIANPKAYQRYLKNPCAEGDSNSIWDCDYKEDVCPYCKGQGIAFAWNEGLNANSVACGNCKGTGKLIKRVKLDIGTGDVQVDCQSCNSTGRLDIPEKEVVHVKTIAQLKRKGDQFAGWQDDSPGYLDIEIDDGNRDFYSKSKPRFEN